MYERRKEILKKQTRMLMGTYQACVEGTEFRC